MSLNPEIQCICRKLNSPKNVIEKADYFLRKLNRKTNGSMGASDMFKYLICVDLAYRDLDIKWDIKIANKLGLKAKQYPMTFNRIQNKLNITKNKTISFEQLSKQFRCTHIKLTFDRIYKVYQTKKLNSLPIIQRKYVNLATPVHKAAIFYVTAVRKGKVKVDGEALCNVMRCDYTKFKSICTDVKQVCFDEINGLIANQNVSRKRKRDCMDDNDNDAQFCDDYTTRKDRKHKEWREKVLKQDLEMRMKRNAKSGKNQNKKRKIMNNTNKKKGKPMKMFSIFEKAKRKKKKNEDEVKSDIVIEIDDDEEDQDIDLKENVDNKENVNNSNQNNKNGNVVIEPRDEPLSAKEAARRAALRRQKMMMNMNMTNSVNDTDNSNQNDNNT